MHSGKSKLSRGDSATPLINCYGLGSIKHKYVQALIHNSCSHGIFLRLSGLDRVRVRK